MMKMIALVAVVMSSVAAQADSIIACPNGTSKVALCQSSPMDHDSELIAEMFDYITVCRGGGSAGGLILTKGVNSAIEQAQVLPTTGATNYFVREGVNRLAFEVMPSGRFGVLKAKLPGNVELASTFRCK